MNCKPGDLAVIVGSRTHGECNGMIVEIVSKAGPAIWQVRGYAIEAFAKKHGLPLRLKDDKLRPIRDGDGEDEMLRIAGLPRPTVEVLR